MIPSISINYNYGCNVKINCPQNKSYTVIIKDEEKILLSQKSNNKDIIRLGRVSGDDYRFIKNVKTYFIKYKVEIYDNENLIFTDTLDLTDKNIKIVIESTALGDNIAWIEEISRFQQINNCKIYLSCPYKELFEKTYTNIYFSDIQFNQNNIWSGLSCYDFNCFSEFCNCYYASYNIGFSVNWLKDPYTAPSDPRKIPLSKVASDILGIEYKETRPKLFVENKISNFKRPYVCISFHSTSLKKYWLNKNGWEKICDFLNKSGFDVVCIDKEHTISYGDIKMSIPKNCIDKTGNLKLQERLTDILNCEFFIGLSSGLSWLAWALDKKVILISGFTDVYTEFTTEYRIINRDVCNSCWNNSDYYELSHNDCPKFKDFECSKSITSDMVIEKINILLYENR